MSDPEIRLHLPNGEFRANPDNTTLFTFMGKLAMYDHVFLQTGRESESTMEGSYLFNQNNSYRELAEFIVQHDFPMVLNRREVPQCDLNAFDAMIKQSTQDLDHLPEDWK